MYKYAHIKFWFAFCHLRTISEHSTFYTLWSHRKCIVYIYTYIYTLYCGNYYCRGAVISQLLVKYVFSRERKRGFNIFPAVFNGYRNLHWLFMLYTIIFWFLLLGTLFSVMRFVYAYLVVNWQPWKFSIGLRHCCSGECSFSSFLIYQKNIPKYKYLSFFARL